MSKPAIREVLAELGERGTAGFRASYIASATGRDIHDVQRDLVEMVDSGDLTLQYQLLCPDDGAVLARYGPDDTLPIGEEIASDDCNPFVVEKRHLWIAYLPTSKLLSSLLREARSEKGRARPGSFPRRALSALGIDLTKRQRSRARSTST